MNQSENRSSRNNEDEQDQEESGWTTYLDDFSLMNNNNNQSDYDSFVHNYSLLSDAASTNYNELGVINHDEWSPKRLNLNKLSRNKKINDPDLEDTASSPVNSPKVSNLKQMEINYRRIENSTGNFLGNEGSSRQFQEMKKVERDNISLDQNGYTNLKKKGLCLVPLSMLVNYYG